MSTPKNGMPFLRRIYKEFTPFLRTRPPETSTIKEKKELKTETYKVSLGNSIVNEGDITGKIYITVNIKAESAIQAVEKFITSFMYVIDQQPVEYFIRVEMICPF
jgi:hypothetical protein